jgi:hypothetical protein
MYNMPTSCPVFDASSLTIEYGALQNDSCGVWQQAECSECEAEWYENYIPADINITSRGKEEEYT